jgi:hypothetical protein
LLVYPGLGVEAVRLVPAQKSGARHGGVHRFSRRGARIWHPGSRPPRRSRRSGCSVRRQHAGFLGRGGHSSSPSVQVVCAALPPGARVPVSAAVKSEEKMQCPTSSLSSGPGSLSNKKRSLPKK